MSTTSAAKAKTSTETVEAYNEQAIPVEEQAVRNAVNAVADKASNVMSFLGNLVFGTGRGTPEQLAELRALITTVRKYLGQITRAYANAASSGMFKPVSDKLNAFWKQTEAAFASNNPKQVQRAVQQAATVAAYTTRFAQIHEDLAALIESHRDDLESGDPTKVNNVLKMMNNIIVRELTAVNLDKLGGVFKRLALVSKNLKLLPAPAGLSPQDLAKDYVDALRQDLEANQKSKAANSADQNDTATSTAPSGGALVMESHMKLNEAVSKLRLESLKEYREALKSSLKEVLAEQATARSGVDKFLAASAAVAKGVSQAEKSAASSTPAKQQQPATGGLTPDQVKRVQTMLQSVASVVGRLTPEQKKQFSSLLGQLKTAIG